MAFQQYEMEYYLKLERHIYTDPERGHNGLGHSMKPIVKECYAWLFQAI